MRALLSSQKSNESKVKPWIPPVVVFLGIVLFLSSVPAPLFAAHSGSISRGTYTFPPRGEFICNRAGDAFGETDRLPNRPGAPGDDSVTGRLGGLHVPVKDFEAEALLRDIANNIRAIEDDINLIEGDTQAIRYYLRQLCEKEYVYDHTIQHAWARVIAQFVNETANWVRNAYSKNPIFLTNQTIYYKLADQEVIEAFLREVEGSNLGQDAKDRIKVEILTRDYPFVFPIDPQGTGEPFAPDDLPDELADPSTFDWGRWDLLARSNADYAAQIALSEFERRREQMRQFEEEKLAWGQGFFSYEICDLQVYTLSSFDRRNCRIITPGSLIQDEVAFVFGSAIRQMELADEFEEWVAPSTIATLNDILNYNGLNNTRDGVAAGGTETRVFPAGSPLLNPADPNRAAEQIIPFEQRFGTGANAIFFPIEFENIQGAETNVSSELEGLDP